MYSLLFFFFSPPLLFLGMPFHISKAQPNTFSYGHSKVRIQSATDQGWWFWFLYSAASAGWIGAARDHGSWGGWNPSEDGYKQGWVDDQRRLLSAQYPDVETHVLPTLPCLLSLCYLLSYCGSSKGSVGLVWGIRISPHHYCPLLFGLDPPSCVSMYPPTKEEMAD